MHRRMISCVVHMLPIEVTGRVGFIKSLDMERVVEADYDQWVKSACGIVAGARLEELYGDGLIEMTGSTCIVR